ncbi:hypothetical protein BC835DRAFT_1419572 [Cytidiella melzeri]|nr:hypothetical protein BC835DRAFT_1419572 [Cytidiella melzeri]
METPYAWEHIRHCSHRILAIIGSNSAHPSALSSSEKQRYLSLNLPDPTPITSYLVRSGWKHAAAEQLSNAYMQHAMDLKLDHERIMNSAINACLEAGQWTDRQANIISLHAAYAAAYRRDLTQWTKFTVQRSEQRLWEYKSSQCTSARVSSSERRSPFKQDATPILERAFSSNPYPTRSEKLTIAGCTGMEYNQVHVWFQNRRNRMKREGKEIRKLAFVSENDRCSYSPFESSEPEPVVFSPSPPRTCSPTPKEEHAEPSLHTHCPFQTDSPPHAYPAVYDPYYEPRPFPILHGPYTFDTPWPRHCATTRCMDTQTAIDMDELSESLSRLNLADKETISASKTQRRPRLCDRSAPCFPSLVQPPAAPLPALVPAIVTVTVHAANPARDMRSPTPSLTRHRVHHQPPATSSVKRKASAKRIPDTLPRRVPQSTPTLVRNQAHPYLSRKPSPPKAKISRMSSTSSLSSVASDDSSSSSFSVDTPLLTPPQLPVALSHTTKDATPELIFGPSRDLDRIFCTSPSSSPGIQVNPWIVH